MRCYFHLVSGLDIIRDSEGINLTDCRHVHGAALQAVEEIRQDSPDADDWEGWELVAMDASHAVLFSIKLSAYEKSPLVKSSFSELLS